MARYIEADELLKRLPDDLPYKASVKRVIMQAPTANVAPIADTIKQFAARLKRYYDDNEKYLGYSIAYNIDQVAESIIKGNTAPDNKCIACGDTIPEGRQVCPGCEGG